jgi:hypothetical protein
MTVSIKFMEGFDNYEDDAALQAAMINCSTLELSADTPFNVGKSAKKPSTAPNNYPLVGWSYQTLGVSTGSSGKIHVAYRLKIDPVENINDTVSLFAEVASASPSCFQIGARDNGAYLGVAWNPTTKKTIAYERGNTVGSSTVDVELKDGNWHTIELSFYRNDSGDVKLWIDNALVLDLADVDIYVGPVLFFALLDGTEGEDTYIDSLVVGTVDDVSDRLTDDASFDVRNLYVSNDDGTNEWTPSTGTDHYAMVDENIADGDTTYLESSGADQEEVFGISVGSDINDVIALEYGVTYKGASSGAACRPMEVFAQSGASEDNFSIGSIIGGNYTTVTKFLDTDPDGGGALTKTAVAAMKFGFRTTP